MELVHAARLDRLQRLSAAQRRRWDQALERYGGIRRAIEHEEADEWAVPAAALARARADREIRAERARDALDSAYRLLVDLPQATPRASAPPQPGEVEIAFFQAAKSWIVFARTSKGVEARRFPAEALTSPESAATILAQISPALAEARRVVVLALGRADQVDWHALTWRGAPLVAHAAVEYSLDLPPVARPAPDDVGGPSVLVVANPTGDLAATEAEGDFVARTAAGWRVSRLSGHEATRDALLAALPSVRLFHYAGHTTSGGPTGASSALILTGGQHIELGDLLALPRVPEVVVLSACRAGSGSGSDGASKSMMGLAQSPSSRRAPARWSRPRETSPTPKRGPSWSRFTGHSAWAGLRRSRELSSAPPATRSERTRRAFDWSCRKRE